ncbi:CPBP family glutamic-type intramembrane protease [Devosia sp. 2618]|uniref:CPBP family glutamic-type intramembrane protease n=1 Tax=Devosia sp. 2618 TaxID=3156454 RepID=UPI003399A2F5
MSRPQIALVVHAIAAITALYFAVPALTQSLSRLGFFASLALYWISFCLPVIAFHVWKRHDGRLFSERLAWRDWWVPGLLLVQVAVTGFVVFAPHTVMLTSNGALLAAATAVIHAPLLEAAWRGGFLTVFDNRPRLGFWLGWLLFTASYVPLGMSLGITLPGGWMALVAGAGLLGLLWSAIAWRTRSVFYLGIAHALTATLYLWVVYNGNGFV